MVNRSNCITWFLTLESMGAPIISANVIGGQGGNGTGGGSGSVTTTAGLFPVGNWNNLTGSSGSSSLVNDVNVVSGTINYTSSNTWAATGSTPAGGGNATMMSGYFDNFAGGSLTVSGLGSSFTTAGYSVYAYFNADSQGTQGFRVTDSLANIDTAFGNQAGGGGSNFPLSGGFIESEDTNSATTTIANVVKLTGFFGPSFTLVGVNGTRAGGDNRARLNGFQIVANAIVPEPASIALWSLLGLCGVAFGATMKRRKT